MEEILINLKEKEKKLDEAYLKLKNDLTDFYVYKDNDHLNNIKNDFNDIKKISDKINLIDINQNSIEHKYKSLTLKLR